MQDLVRQDNDAFLGELPPEVASLVINSPDVLHAGGSDDMTETVVPEAEHKRQSIEETTVEVASAA
jgi:hypothetical protein